MHFKTSLATLIFLVAITTAAQSQDRYRFKIGDEFTVTSEIKQEIEQTMFGQTMETIQNITTVDKYEVVEASNNEYLLKTTGLSRSIYTETGGGSVSFDSNKEGDEHLAFRALTNKSFYVRINQYGRFLGFEGMDAFDAAVKADLVGTDMEGQGDELLSSFDEETLGVAVDGQFYIYPESGKSWSRKATMKVNQLPVSVSFDFERTGKHEISAAGPMSLSGDFEVMGQMMSADIEGIQNTVFTLDKKTGLPLNINTLQEMEGDLNVSDLSVPMSLKTIVKVTITK